MSRTVRGSALAILAAVLLLSGCAVTTIRSNPDFAKGNRKIDKIALLPPDVSFMDVVFNGDNQHDTAAEAAISRQLVSSAKMMLEQRGYTVNTDLIARLNKGDKNLNFEYEQLKSAYVQRSKELYAQYAMSEDEAKKFKLTVGPLVNIFAQASGADALLLMHYSGFSKSSGVIAKEIVASALLAVLTGAVAVPAKTGGTVEVALIDGVNGNILWTNLRGAPGNATAALGFAIAKFPTHVPQAEDQVAKNVQPVKRPGTASVAAASASANERGAAGTTLGPAPAPASSAAALATQAKEQDASTTGKKAPPGASSASDSAGATQAKDAPSAENRSTTHIATTSASAPASSASEAPAASTAVPPSNDPAAKHDKQSTALQSRPAASAATTSN